MKGGIITATLLVLLDACHGDTTISPPDWLYQRWRLVQIQTATGNQIVDATNNDWAITEFRPNGTILYGVTGRFTACCSPNRFTRNGNKLDLKDVSSIPVPETDGNCMAVKCAGSGDTWQIIVLLPEALTLQTNTGINVYQAYH